MGNVPPVFGKDLHVDHAVVHVAVDRFAYGFGIERAAFAPVDFILQTLVGLAI